MNLSKRCRDDASRDGDRLPAEQRVATDERIPRLASHWLCGRYSIVRVPLASQVALYRATVVCTLIILCTVVVTAYPVAFVSGTAAPSPLSAPSSE